MAGLYLERQVTIPGADGPVRIYQSRWVTGEACLPLFCQTIDGEWRVMHEWEWRLRNVLAFAEKE